jgi:redox-sensitive bicupin YhaK (pirin superfamily)
MHCSPAPGTPTAHTHWQAQAAAVGHTTVLRALPTSAVQAVGPFVFLDHFGPAPSRAETLPAHPHAGIEVMTYLLEGANEHRDSKGHRGTVRSGGAQWMRAGSGILHAETVLPALGPTVHGLQLWARLPVALQDSAPAYRGIDAEDVPTWVQDDCELRLLAGDLSARKGPIELALPALMLHLLLPPGAQTRLVLPSQAHEYGLYGITADAGQLSLDDGIALPRGGFVQLKSGTGSVRLHNAAAATHRAELFVLGGEPAPRPLVFGGPFVLDSHAALEQAQRRYFSGQMGRLDGVPN